jgi:tRNA (mo5U34)-methyltransferase
VRGRPPPPGTGCPAPGAAGYGPRVPEETLAAAVAAHPGWYHTIELPEGVTTPGFCDLRPFAGTALPASFGGKRVLDVGTFDGFWAFEAEKRGAATVFALDLEKGTDADWPPNTAAENLAASEAQGLEWGSGFALAHRALGSGVQRVEGNVYDLTPDWLGGRVHTIVCSTVLQHLRDPIGALERIRETLLPGGELLLLDTYSVAMTRLHPRRPIADFRPAMPGSKFTWWVPNLAALRGWATTAGFRGPGEELTRHKPLRGAGAGDHLVSLRFLAP